MGVENPAVTTCFELYRPSSAKISAAMVSLREYWRYIPQRTLAIIPSNQFFFTVLCRLGKTCWCKCL